MSVSAEPTLLDFEPESIAQQLAVIEWALFSKIDPTDIVKRGPEPHRRSEDDNIDAVVQTSNKIAIWVAGIVLEEEDVDKRARILEHLIRTTDNCRSLSNFNTVAALVAGLSSAPVFSLKQTWSRVGKEQIEALDGCRALIDPMAFKKYQETLRGVEPPCIPFIGAYLMLLSQPKDTRPSDDDIVQEVRKWQRTPYSLERDEQLERFLREQLGKYEGKSDGFDDASRQLESGV
ncbi:ras GEF [Peniophora sp. CONT]|nr:ras GEF [Peniophora sp. CONT]